jgi:hypothetical protein
LNGATITDALGKNAALTLPAPGTPGSFRSNNTTIAGAPPHILSVTTLTANGGYGIGLNQNPLPMITIEVTFSSPVAVNFQSDRPFINLNANDFAFATLAKIANDFSTILDFTYTVRAGGSSPHLDYTSATALILPTGATITAKNITLPPDAPAVNADVTLPPPGSANSLSGTSAIAVQDKSEKVPFVANVTSTALR